ncbi:hypothetical protein QCA50_004606 [Cerrena zonata]|uniref:Uncharacterized protein n=1 Tax=Cerrena zonata TaxID=2478898 RepID=A0AAW0GUD0_9APHY
MPAKAHHRSAGGIVRTHSRTSSTGSGKAGLGLQLTQKEPAAPRYADKQTKRNSHLHHETHSRTTSPVPRTNSRVRLQSREQLQHNAHRGAPHALTSTSKSAGSKQKVGFTISSPSEGDDDEWVSSESGAATPLNGSDTETTAVALEPAKPSIQRTTSRVNGFAAEEQPTPRARTPTALPPVDNDLPPTPQRRDHVSELPQPLSQLGSPFVHEAPPQQLHQSPPKEIPAPIPRTRSETHSPPRRSPDHAIQRHSLTRPPSTHSVSARADTLRPHPLIRANSYGQGILGPAKPAPLAPLTTVMDENAPAEMSTTTSPTSFRAVSPAPSNKTTATSPDLPHTSPAKSEASRQLRRTSTSSVRSTATMPAIPSASQVQLTRANHDRQRTLSSTSSFAALSNFAMRSTPSPTRPQIKPLIVTFPTNQDHNEMIHPLLPPPYLSAHLTMLQYRNPLAESYERIMRAKQAL